MKGKIRPVPADIQKLVDEIEDLAGTEIELQHNPDCRGAMSSQCGSPPVIEYRSSSDYTDNGLMHELLHVRLGLRGYPSIPNNLTDIMIHRVGSWLENVFHHTQVLPELDSAGRSTRQDETRAWHDLMDQALRMNDGYVYDNDKTHAFFAMLFVKAHVECILDDVNNKVKEVFALSQFTKAQTLGNKVLSEIETGNLATPQIAATIMRKCLEILKMERHLSIVYNDV